MNFNAKQILLNYKIEKLFKDILIYPEKNNKISKTKLNKLNFENNKKYIHKTFFNDLKNNFIKYFPDKTFTDIFKNPYLIDFQDEDEEYYIFKIEKGFVYEEIAPSIESNTIIHLNYKLNEFFQKQFNTKITLICETHKINDIVFNDTVKFHDIKKLVLIKDPITF